MDTAYLYLEPAPGCAEAADCRDLVDELLLQARRFKARAANAVDQTVHDALMTLAGRCDAAAAAILRQPREHLSAGIHPGKG